MLPQAFQQHIASHSTGATRAMQSITDANESLASMIAAREKPTSSGLDLSPIHHTRAYQVAESEEELSGHKLVEVEELSQGSISSDNMYLFVQTETLA